MLKKALAALLCFTFPLFGGDKEQIKLLAQDVKSLDEKIIEAKGDVLILSQKYTIKASRARYNRVSGDIELFDNVNLIQGGEVYALSDYVMLNLGKEQIDFSKFVAVNQSSHVWIKSKEGKKRGDIYTLEQKSITSSCDLDDPAWSISFHEGEYDTHSKWLSLKHAVFYANDIPVLYLPYFAYPADKTRRTGLLIPQAGYISNQGLFYAQSLYFAPQPDYDIELTPQVRSQRGSGLYTAFRFKDTPYSKGFVRVGVFNDKKSYQEEQSLKYRQHDGLEVGYESEKLFAKGHAQDGLYLDAKKISDIDYLNLQTVQEYGEVPQIITSKFNYFYRLPEDYFGIYTRYYQDTSKDNNDETLQTFPSLQYHRFTRPLLGDHLFYSLDARWINHYRKTGVEANQFELDIPLSLTFPLFDEYLRFTASENVYLTDVVYQSQTDPLNDARLLKNYHRFELQSDLAKMYQHFFHTINVGLAYTIPSAQNKKGDFADFIALNTEAKSIKGSFEQHFLSPHGEEFLYHRLEQTRYLENGYERYGDLENEIRYHINTQTSLSNRLLYSHTRHTVALANTTLAHQAQQYRLAMSHYYTHDGITSKSENIYLDVKRDLGGNVALFSGVNYDIQENFTKSWEAGWSYGKRCWDYTVRFRSNRVPVLNNQGTTTSIGDRSMMVYFRFHPIGGISQKFTMGGQDE